MKKTKNRHTAGYTALSFLIQVRPMISSLKVNFVKSPPQFLIITY